MSDRTDGLLTGFYLVGGLAVASNAVNAFGGPDSTLWDICRFTISILATVALIALLGSYVKDRADRNAD